MNTNTPIVIQKIREPNINLDNYYTKDGGLMNDNANIEIKDTNNSTTTKIDGNSITVDGSLRIGSTFSQGSSTTASGGGSHAEGFYTIASGEYSHAEGSNATASGDYSHAEGDFTEASGDSSHAEGLFTIASGNSSYAGGNRTIASGNFSHAEGQKTTASGQNSHAEGQKTTASGSNSHAEGLWTIASNPHTHTEGCNTIASGHNSHAEGYLTKASGSQSHVEGNGRKILYNNITLTGSGDTYTLSQTCPYIVPKETIIADSNNYIYSIIEYNNDKIIKLAESTTNLNGLTVSIYGIGTEAYGNSSHAEGYNTMASGNYSHAEGYQTISNKNSSHAEGYKTVTNGDYSHAEGYQTVTNGDYSHAEGYKTEAWGEGSHAEGYGYNSVSIYQDSDDDTILSTWKELSYSLARGKYSHVEGFSNLALGERSHAEGESVVALNFQHAQGHYNDYTTAYANNNPEGTGTGTAFVIGNGTYTNRSNAFRVNYNGKPYCKQSYTTTGADYAEYFEWQDFNKNKEDRRGYFVTLDGEKIKIAKSKDYILGVVSGLPAIVGNGDESWMGRYCFDEFGDFIYENFEYEREIINEYGEKEIVIKTGIKYKENPEYDPTQIYIPREERPEWDAIGMMGVLAVRDDGTCQVNGYCSVTNEGIATASETGYRVIKRVNDNIVKIVFR